MLSDVVTTWKLQFGPGAQDVRGKTILVVGDGNGGGRMTAELLASCGARVFLGARSSAALAQSLEAVRQNGGEGDGMVIDIRGAQQAGQFFAEAERCFGPIHAVINYLPLDADLLPAAGAPDSEVEDCQNAITQEALLHMQNVARGQIVNIGQAKNRAASRTLAAAMRHQAKELGIRVTLVEPGETQDANIKDIVQCVFRSLVQPFGVDVIFMQRQNQA
jgi:NAD(P)-dependent dehydrogenase (short-subunit alcohol dehydrogenase family)